MTNPPVTQCPQCHEPVQPNWRICPVCETRLQPLSCPACSADVKANWKRCPECEALLVCPVCKRRLRPGESSCSQCKPDAQVLPTKEAPENIVDPVTGIELVFIKGGTFRMGDLFDRGSDNEQPVCTVSLDDYYMAVTPVTQAQWQKLNPDNPSHFQGASRPVEQVSWDDAMQFVDQLNQAAGQPWHFDLPTEAQWEYAACSGGKKQLYAGGDDINALAWFEDNSRGGTQPVATKAANGLGLFDMSGNVWEWCKDAYSADAYGNYPQRNPLIELPSLDRTIRGGSWHLDAWSARCSRRFACARDFFGPGLGFRLIMTPS